jgi:hypothetical protein
MQSQCENLTYLPRYVEFGNMKASKPPAPLILEFSAGSRIEPATEESSGHTFVLLKDGTRVALPTDQVVSDESLDDAVRIGLGGMSFEGVEGDDVVLWRVHNPVPETIPFSDRFTDEVSDKLTLASQNISRVLLQGNQVWPRTPSAL